MTNLTNRMIVEHIVEKLQKQSRKFHKLSLPAAKCPDRKTKRKCRLMHANLEVIGFDRVKNKFHIRSYPIHSRKFSEAWITPEKLKNNLETMYSKHMFTRNHVAEQLDLTSLVRSIGIHILLTKKEFKRVEFSAKRNNMNTSDFIRSRIL